jgi:hypothetical protein
MTPMADTEAQSSYRPPSVKYHGRVGDLTLSHSLLVGARAARFAASFASSLHSSHATGGGSSTVLGANEVSGGHAPAATATPTSLGGHGSHGGREVLAAEQTTSPPSGAGGAAGAGSGSGSGGGGGGGGKLPFTGLAIVAVSGAGAALVSAGSMIRRLARRGARSER